MPVNCKIVFLMSLVCSALGLGEVKAAGERCLPFGSTPVGEVYISGGARENYLRPAVGKVCLPPTGDIILDLKPNQLNNGALFQSRAVQTQIAGLSLVHTNADDRWLSSVPNLRHIHNLQLDGLTITDRGVTALVKFTKLEVLHLPRTKVTGANLSILRGLPLRTLRLGYTQLSQSTFTELATLHHLKDLDMEYAELTGLAAKRRTSSAAQLDSLCAPLLSRLRKLPKLEALNLSGFPIGKKSFDIITSLPRLSALWVAFTNVDAIALSHLKPKQMNALNVSQCAAINDEAMSTIANMHRLQVLNLSKTKISRIGVERLSTLRELKMLNLSYNDLRGTKLSFLKNAITLYDLNLSGTGIGNQAIHALNGLPALRTLTLADNSISDESIKDLSALKQLKLLDLGESQLTSEGFRRLRKALPKCKILGYGSDE